MVAFSITSNAENVFEDLMRSMQAVEDHAEENLRRAVVDSIAIIAHRIQQRGESAEGSRLRTKSRIRNGAYSRQYAKRRAERGRQTDHVDMTMDGDLMRNLQVLSTSPTEATGGFLDNKQGEIAVGLEEYYNEPIFELSTKEQDFVLDGWIPRIQDDLRTR